MPSVDQQSGFQSQNYPMKLRMYQGGLGHYAFGGLNTTGGPITLADNDSSSLQNIDFNKFGSIVKRGGTQVLNPNSILAGTGPQLLVDGGFEQWNSATVLTDWTPINSAEITRVTSPVVQGTYAASMVGSGIPQPSLRQSYAPYSTLAGQTVNFSASVWCASANQAFININDGATLSNSSTHPGDSTYHTLSVSHLISNSASQLNFNCAVNAGSAVTAIFDNASSAVALGTPQCDGLYWFEYNNTGTFSRQPITVSGAGVYYMPGLNGTWSNITPSGITMTQGSHADFETFLGNAYITNGSNPPIYWNGTGQATVIPSLQDNCITFQVTGITVVPTIGSHYQSNGVNFTIIGTNLSGPAGSIGGQLVCTGIGEPTVSGSLTKLSGTGDGSISFDIWVINANIQTAKYVAQYQNYLFFGNVTVDNAIYNTRVYWCNIEDPLSWDADSWIDVSRTDGQEITNIVVLGQNLVVYKTRSVYLITFTGNADAPFVVERANPDIGCIAPFSVQETENSHIFLGPNGIYTFDGVNCIKVSYEIDSTFINNLNRVNLNQAVSAMYKTKNRYLLAVPSAGSSQNDTIIMFDYYMDSTLNLTPFSIYQGWKPSAMATFYINGWDEKPYYADYSGYTYQTDVGLNDYPLNIKTAINAYYYTNWKSYDDLIHQKFGLSAYIYYSINTATLGFSYSYDFQTADQYVQLIPTSSGGSTWGNFIWGQAKWATSGGAVARSDLNGRGRSVRFKFSNSNMDETFSVDGFGILETSDTNE